jgi:hypothetical protein
MKKIILLSKGSVVSAMSGEINSALYGKATIRVLAEKQIIGNTLLFDKLDLSTYAVDINDFVGALLSVYVVATELPKIEHGFIVSFPSDVTKDVARLLIPEFSL